MQLPKIYHMVTIEVLSNYFVSFYSLYGNHSVIYMKGNNISQYTNKDSIDFGLIILNILQTYIKTKMR